MTDLAPAADGTPDPRAHAATVDLLAEVHPDDQRFADASWVDWLYDGNPIGPAVEQSRDRGGRRIGHVGLVPQRWHRADEEIELLLTVNAATLKGQALLTGLVGRGVREAILLRPELHAGYGVANDASSIPALRRLRATMMGRLPIRVLRPSLPRGVESRPVDAELLGDGTVEEVAEGLAHRPETRWAQRWTPEVLAWRLAAPGADYSLHLSDDLVAVSTSVKVRGVRVGVLLKLLPRRGPVDRRAVRRMVGAVQRHRRVPVVVYAGFNRAAPVSGPEVPERLRPAALNLFVIGSDAAAALLDRPELEDLGTPVADLRFEAFELLDFDAL